MRLALDNAALNRGIVVATPTSLKSIMLVYIETLRLLDEMAAKADKTAAAREKAEALSSKARELAGILSRLQSGVMLLDEVPSHLNCATNHSPSCASICPSTCQSNCSPFRCRVVPFVLALELRQSMSDACPLAH